MCSLFECRAGQVAREDIIAGVAAVVVLIRPGLTEGLAIISGDLVLIPSSADGKGLQLMRFFRIGEGTRVRASSRNRDLRPSCIDRDTEGGA